MSSIYLDNNATTRLDSSVADQIDQLNRELIANPASQHLFGRKALQMLEGSRNELLMLTGAATEGMHAASVVLTSGGTEANNLALLGLRSAAFDSPKPILITAATEHPSVSEAAQQARRLGHEHRVLAVDTSGAVNLQQLENWLTDDAARIRLVSVMYGNNETGILQDLGKICSLCSQYAVPVHSDVVQAIGKIPLNMEQIGLSAMTLTAHKIHGPVGVGALIVRHGMKIEPMLLGGGQQLGIRPGTEPVTPAVALTAAVRTTIAARNEGAYDRLQSLRDDFEATLRESTGAVIIGNNAARLPHTSNVAFRGLDRQALQMSLDLAGIACSTGSACSSGSARPSGALVAMGYDEELIGGSLRFSFSKYTTAQQVATAAEVVTQIVQKQRA